MAIEIERQLAQLLQPLLTAPLIVKGDVPSPQQPYAELSMISCAALGLGNEVSQGVDNEGDIAIRVHHRAEIAIYYHGADVVAQLSKIMDGLQRITMSEQLQMAQIGVEGSAKLKTGIKEDAGWKPDSDSYLSFHIHYSITFNDPVGSIENVHAATEGGVKKIKLTR
ncbi:MAG: hypothetical protein ACRC5A_16135 [Enterobacteriaceae bacterium]